MIKSEQKKPMNKFAYPDETRETVMEELVGAELAGGWIVTKRLTRKAFQSGSCFSVGYVVEREGESAFMKAFDFWDALRSDDVIGALNGLTETYVFERELLEMCGKAKMTKVVRAKSYGGVNDSRAPLGQVFYVLFELADSDVRAHLVEQRSELSWRMRSLHHVSTALQQLHRRGIYHQDLKPSNVLVFLKDEESKLGDLGRAHCVSKSAPHDASAIPGAFRYAPPELLYQSPLNDALGQKRASDLYLFGSMISFFVAGTPLTPLLLKYLSEEHAPFIAYGKWKGFFRDALPFLDSAFEEALGEIWIGLVDEIGEDHHSKPIIDEIILLVRYASSPDPEIRGHPTTRRRPLGNPYDLERFVTAFDLIARRLLVRRT